MMTILPDPNNPMGADGEANPAGTPGPGFAGVRIGSIEPFMMDRTNSGRVISRGEAAQYWTVDISYNPMLRSEFDVIYAFILSKRGGLIPFFVELPEYGRSDMTVNPTVNGLTAAGVNSLTFNAGTVTPARGDLFYIYDTNDTSHTKAYKVSGVSGSTLYFNPPLSKETSDTSELVFDVPRIRVIMSGDIIEHSLNTENLYSFALRLEEAQN